jgi:hypothetical protein
MTRKLLFYCTAVLLAGCAAAPQAALPREPEPARARAALSVVFVENRTAERLSIAYRLAAHAAAEVTVGTVAPDSVVRLAPLPAGEPLSLIARTGDGRQLALEPRSFGLGTEWTWLIDADARFTPPED